MPRTSLGVLLGSGLVQWPARVGMFCCLLLPPLNLLLARGRVRLAGNMLAHVQCGARSFS